MRDEDNDTVTMTVETFNTLQKEANRYRYIIAQYARSRGLHMDGTASWFLTSPYLGKPGRRTATIDEAIDEEMREHSL